MKQVSKKSFLPTEISESIVMGESEIFVTFRNVENIKNIPLNGWYTQDINQLCRKLVVKQIQIQTHNYQSFDQISNKLNVDLVHLNQT